MSNLTAADLIFSGQANNNFSRILADLKRSNLSITNRLKSIRHDAAFVNEVAAAFNNRPLVANERCGSWYIEPPRKIASAYFKSTDGHTGQWKFSSRRLNLHLLPLIGRHDGCIIVDSTRRGKRMPDALSKTAPIWCCVLNRVLFPDDTSTNELYVPPNVVSDSEQSQMLARIPEFVASFAKLELDVDVLSAQLRKPMRPIWVTQETQLLPTEGVFEAFHPIICCTSSRRVIGTEMSEGGYIQGAGDDTENWALGLTPSGFWEHADQLLSTPESELPDLITSLVAGCGSTTINPRTRREITKFLSVGSLNDSGDAGDDGVCKVLLTPTTTKAETWTKAPSLMEVGIGKHKAASRNLRQALPRICSFVSEYLGGSRSTDGTRVQKHVLVLCETGKDISVGIALALLCYCFNEDGDTGTRKEEARLSKDLIRVRLGKIMTAMPEANPSRATLQSVNSFLMDWRN